jgi:NDP-sugar pyrophosphorylase family protein
MNTTLVVLAAGMGSRYGGLKQMDGVGPNGETLLDYSVFDAVRSGFSRVVFVIRRDFEEQFRDCVGLRFEDRIEVGYAFQQLNDLPGAFSVPSGRVKPWGTGHAIWCAREAVDTPFLAINADDFYGRPAITAVGTFLEKQVSAGTDFCMAGYQLASTLSLNGSVSRGVCSTDANGFLLGVREHTKLQKTPEGIVDSATGDSFSGLERVSMNCWGFTPEVFPLLERGLMRFLDSSAGVENSEYYIPSAVEEMITSGAARVSVLPVDSPWFGVTYREDRPMVVESLASLGDKGDYPTPLWTV